MPSFNQNIVKIKIITGILLCFYSLQAQNDFKHWKTDYAKQQTVLTKIRFLDSLTKQMIRSDASAQVEAIYEFIRLTIANKDPDKAAQKSRFLIQYYSYRGEAEKAWELLNRMLFLKPDFRNEGSLAHLLLKRGGLNFKKGDLEASITDYKEAVPLFFKSNDSIYAADAYYFMAQAYDDLKQPVPSVQNLKNAYLLYEQLGDIEYAMRVKFEMSDFFRENGMIDRAMNIWEDLLNQSKVNDYPCMQVMTTWYLLKERSKNLKESEFSRALKELVDMNSTCDDAYLVEKFRVFIDWLGVNYYLEHNFVAEADSLYQRISYYDQVATSHYEKGIFLADEAKYLNSKGKTNKAISLVETYLNSSEKSSTMHRIELLGVLLELTKKVENNASRIGYSEELLQLKDSLYKASVAHNYALNQANFELFEKDKQIEKDKRHIDDLTHTSSRFKTQTYVILGVISVILLVFAWAIWSYKRRVRKQLIKNDKLEEQIDEKTEVLDQLIVNTVKELKKKEVLKERLKNLSKDNDKAAVEGIITDLKLSKSDDEKQILLTENLKRVSDSFNRRLLEAYPQLTKTELEVLRFMKIGMSRKEIAQIRNTSLEAVKKIRSRIKKKLNLGPDASIDEFVNQF